MRILLDEHAFAVGNMDREGVDEVGSSLPKQAFELLDLCLGVKRCSEPSLLT